MTSMLMDRVKANWKSGVTVSLVSIPLSISLAVASETTPIAGIITAIWAGLIASLFGGSNFNVVGPTGALSGLIAIFSLQHGASSLSMLAITTGLLILGAFALRLERYLVFIPSSVIHGFTLGVAFIIGFGQFNYAFGLSGLPKHEHFIENLFESFKHLSHASLPAVAVFAVFIAGLFALKKLLPKLPGAIILSPLGILLGFLTQKAIIPLHLETLGGKFGEISATLFAKPHFFLSASLITTSLTIALIAILETMLSAKVADGMTKTKHNERKEMLGLGLANIGSGLMGGIPATAALARTALNIKTGATHKTSGTINSITIAVISLVLFSFFTYIPMAVIAAILVNTAINMIEKEHLRHLYTFSKVDFGVAILVAAITIYADPIIGILAGATASLLIYAEKNARGRFVMILNDEKNGVVKRITSEDEEVLEHDILVYSFKGSLSYLASRSHVSRFEHVAYKSPVVILRFRSVSFVDYDGIEAIAEIIEGIEAKGSRVLLTSMNDEIQHLFRDNSLVIRKLMDENRLYSKTSEALEAARAIIRTPKPTTV